MLKELILFVFEFHFSAWNVPVDVKPMPMNEIHKFIHNANRIFIMWRMKKRVNLGADKFYSVSEFKVVYPLAQVPDTSSSNRKSREKVEDLPCYQVSKMSNPRY